MTNHLHYKTCNKTLIRKTLLLLFIWVWNAKMQPPRVEKFGKINPKSKKFFSFNLGTEGWHYRFNLNIQISKISSIFLKKLKCLTPVFCHFRGGLLCFLQLITKNLWKWLKLHFIIFKNKLESLDICMLRLNLKRHPSVLRLIKKFLSLIFGFILPNFMTLGD